MLADRSHCELLRDSARRRFNGQLNLATSVDRNLDLLVIDSAWVAEAAPEIRNKLAAAVMNRIPVVSLDEFYESLFGKVASIQQNDLAWAIDHVLSRSGSLYFKGKRVVDIVVATALLVISGPIVVVAACLIRLVDRMPAFYGQPRVGYLRRPFVLWKLRTMAPGADAGGPFVQGAGETDPRVTNLGGFLRRFRIDELPQFWNVVRGEMSLVGPRPEWVQEARILEQQVPNYHIRHLVTPGITGWAQVYFRATNGPEGSIEKQHYDLYYLKHFSLALDFSIMLKTIKRVLIKDSRLTLDERGALTGREPRNGAVHLDVASIVGPSADASLGRQSPL